MLIDFVIQMARVQSHLRLDKYLYIFRYLQFEPLTSFNMLEQNFVKTMSLSEDKWPYFANVTKKNSHDKCLDISAVCLCVLYILYTDIY